MTIYNSTFDTNIRGAELGGALYCDCESIDI